MNNPKEKAADLIEKFKSSISYCGQTDLDILEDAKDCAIIAVDGIIEALNAFGYVGAMYDDFETGDKVFTTDKDPTEFWQQVKNELTK